MLRYVELRSYQGFCLHHFDFLKRICVNYCELLTSFIVHLRKLVQHNTTSKVHTLVGSTFEAIVKDPAKAPRQLSLPTSRKPKHFETFSNLKRTCSSPFALSFNASLVQLKSCWRNDGTDLPTVSDRTFNVWLHFPLRLVCAKRLGSCNPQLRNVYVFFSPHTWRHILNLWQLSLSWNVG